MLRSVIGGAAAVLATAAVGASAIAQPATARGGPKVRLAAAATNNGCDAGAYNVTVSPDGTALSILFDDFVVHGGQEIAKRCTLSIPLNLPEGYSLGVYQVDYRGYAHLAEREAALFTVDYVVGPRGNGRGTRHRLRGPTDDSFTLTDTLRPGILRRIGCGEAAKIDFNAVLGFRRGEGSSEALLSLDSADGTRAPGGVTFKFDLKPCQGSRP
ncbi:MAG: DUF4360 domain-containing protein [Caulobacteraceae bacterium]|nr:DUF4360 domain-containing protein [Caulobacteraceae bacterium]